MFFNQVNITWDKNIDKKHYTNAIEAVGVNNIRLNNVIASPSPSNTGMATILLQNCKGFYNDNPQLTVAQVR